MGIEMRGFDELASRLEKMSDRAASFRVANRALRAGAEVILDEMKRRTATDPRPRTGDLREALAYDSGKLTREKKMITIGVHRKDWEKREHKPAGGENYYYPAYVEYGHQGPAPAPAHPYLRISFDTMSPEALAAIRQVLEDELK